MNYLKQKRFSLPLISFLILFILWFFGDDYKCPDDYQNSEEKVADFDKWAKDFYNRNPDASFADLNDARGQFYIDHNCTEALQRSKDWESGNVDPETKEMIMETIKDSE